jgi:hypothetical protein
MTDRDHRDTGPERPRSEPEIIPPGQRGPSQVFVSIDEDGRTQRIYLAQPGPFTILLGLAVFGLIAVVALVLLLSVALIWIPVAIVLVAAFVGSVMIRRWWHKLRQR